MSVRIATLDDAPRVAELVGADPVEFMQRATVLLNEHGGFFLEPITSSILEAHMFFEPEGRGKHAIEAAHDGLKIAFRDMGAAIVFGRIPVEDRPARMLTRLIGFVSDGIRPREPGGPLVEWFEMRSPY